ncbi:MAG: DNA repair protein RadA, partial [Candidatus Caldatribacteriaceae bacterium]
MVYLCKGCGYSTPNWLGRCPQCGEWNSFFEVRKERQKKKSYSATSSSIPPLSLAELEKSDFPKERRFSTGLKEVDRVLG